MVQKKFQDIIAPKGGRKRAPVLQKTVDASPSVKQSKIHREDQKIRLSPRRSIYNNSSGEAVPCPQKKNRLLWVVALSSAVFLVISFSMFFEQATLKITPKQKTAPLDDVFNAFFKEEGANEDSGNLRFETFTIKQEESTTIPATEAAQVERSASGKIIIFNEFNSQNQRLIKNTRFETSGGLIYRIQKSIIVPGQKKVDGKIVPGSVEVIVYADSPGEEFNIGFSDFTIPGFKGTPQYNNFYARSKTEITGGFSGTVKTVSESQIKETKSDLREIIREKLQTNAQAQKPATLVLYPGAIFIEFTPNDEFVEQADEDKDTVLIKESATLYGILFDIEELSKNIAQKLFFEPDETDRVTVLNISELEFAIDNKELIDPTDISDISFSLKGNPKVVWQFNERELQEQLLGKPKDDLKLILAQFPSIARAEVTLRPFWKQSFSDKIKDITIEKIIEEN